jgi:hypothetical protein
MAQAVRDKLLRPKPAQLKIPQQQVWVRTYVPTHTCCCGFSSHTVILPDVYPSEARLLKKVIIKPFRRSYA